MPSLKYYDTSNFQNQSEHQFILLNAIDVNCANDNLTFGNFTAVQTSTNAGTFDLNRKSRIYNIANQLLSTSPAIHVIYTSSPYLIFSFKVEKEKIHSFNVVLNFISGIGEMEFPSYLHLKIICRNLNVCAHSTEVLRIGIT